jgi:CRISPR/Cas system Type II protein with McrA/HNH and RuvC-like nuclease domain
LRESISKKLRFEIFKRDYFECQYCGSSPPSVILEIDHILPVSQKGTNDIDNLVTACFDCNRGKSNNLLTSIPQSVSDKAELMAEKLAQVKAYDKLLRSIRKYEETRVDLIQEIFNAYHDGYSFSQTFRKSVRLFLDKLDINEVEKCMEISCSKGRDRESTIRYFCGICWNRIRSKNA